MENKQYQNQEDVIDLMAIALDLWRKLPLILLVTVFTAIIGWAYSSFKITPMYQSTTTMYVLMNQDDSKGTTMSDMQMGALLSSDYSEVIKSRHVLETTIEQLGLNMTYGQLLSEISVSNSKDTRILSLTVTDASPINAMQIADTVREVASEHIQNVMNIEAVNVIDKANMPTTKCSPSIQKYTMLGAMGGFVLMCGIFVVLFLLNDKIQTPEDIEKKLGISCLAVVPINPNIKKRKKAEKKAKKA